MIVVCESTLQAVADLKKQKIWRVGGNFRQWSQYRNGGGLKHTLTNKCRHHFDKLITSLEPMEQFDVFP